MTRIRPYNNSPHIHSLSFPFHIRQGVTAPVLRTFIFAKQNLFGDDCPFDLTYYDSISLELYNINGQKCYVGEFTVVDYQTSEIEHQWDSTWLLDNGVYFAKIIMRLNQPSISEVLAIASATVLDVNSSQSQFYDIGEFIVSVAGQNIIPTQTLTIDVGDTPTIVGQKIADAINAEGVYSATQANGVITIVAPPNTGDSLNTTEVSMTSDIIVVTTDYIAFNGGVTSQPSKEHILSLPVDNKRLLVYVNS